MEGDRNAPAGHTGPGQEGLPQGGSIRSSGQGKQNRQNLFPPTLAFVR